MTGEKLREAVRALLTSHPAIAASPVGHKAHAELYLAENGSPIGFEHERKEFQNLYVRATSVRLSKLGDLSPAFFDHRTFSTNGKPNHNLFSEPAFKECDLLRFRVTDLWQAVRVLSEVAGDGA